MSTRHPVIAVTGSSGAGTSTVKTAREHIFLRESLKACIVEGDSFHKYDRYQMRDEVAKAQACGENLSHFGPDGNHFEKLESLFRDYGETGTGKIRYYLHNDEESAPYKQKPGTFTPWEDIGDNTDMLFYEGLHGGVVNDKVNIAQHVDLLVGVVPIVNLEWIQKIHRDTASRGYEPEAVTETILRRMHDYVHYIAPSFPALISTSSACRRLTLQTPLSPETSQRLMKASALSVFVVRTSSGWTFPICCPCFMTLLFHGETPLWCPAARWAWRWKSSSRRSPIR